MLIKFIVLNSNSSVFYVLRYLIEWNNSPLSVLVEIIKNDLACAVVYENGLLVRGLTRGDGRIGDNLRASPERRSSQACTRRSTCHSLDRQRSKRRRARPLSVPSTYSAANASIILGSSCFIVADLSLEALTERG